MHIMNTYSSTNYWVECKRKIYKCTKIDQLPLTHFFPSSQLHSVANVSSCEQGVFLHRDPGLLVAGAPHCYRLEGQNQHINYGSGVQPNPCLYTHSQNVSLDKCPKCKCGTAEPPRMWHVFLLQKHRCLSWQFSHLLHGPFAQGQLKDICPLEHLSLVLFISVSASIECMPYETQYSDLVEIINSGDILHFASLTLFAHTVHGMLPCGNGINIITQFEIGFEIYIYI